MLLTTMLCAQETLEGVLKVLQPKCDYSNQDEEMRVNWSLIMLMIPFHKHSDKSYNY